MDEGTGIAVDVSDAVDIAVGTVVCEGVGVKLAVGVVGGTFEYK